MNGPQSRDGLNQADPWGLDKEGIGDEVELDEVELEDKRAVLIRAVHRGVFPS